MNAPRIREDNRVAVLRERAKRIGLRLNKNRDEYTLWDGDTAVACGPLDAVQAYVGQRYQCRPPRGQRWVFPPPAWASHIEDHLTTLAAGGRSPATINLRRDKLVQMARELGGSPADVTSEQLLTWLGSHPGWSAETRKTARTSARLFFHWAYKTGRVPTHIADDLPAVRVPPPAARAVPDHVWETALASADARAALILRLAGQAGLRRGEISRIHGRDLIDSGGSAKLLVHGKGGKDRLVPLSDSLAQAVRAGAAGHTPGASASGWLFPNMSGGHLTAQYVGIIISDLLPDGWTLHKLRHRFATRAYRGSRNLRAVQTLLGHSSIATTQRYLEVNEDETRAAMLAAL